MTPTTPFVALLNFGSRCVRALWQGVCRAWLLVLPLVLGLSFIRAVQIGHFWPPGFEAAASDVVQVLWQGLRFDLKVSAIAAFVLLLVLPWVSQRVYLRIGVALVFAYVMASLVNLHYFGFYKTPIDALIFGLAEDDTVAILQTIWRDFPVIGTLFSAAVLTAALVWLHRRLVGRLQPDTWLQQRSAAVQLLALLLAVFVLMLAGKGTLRAMALQQQHLTVTASPFLNDMVPNGVVALNYAWKSRGSALNLKDVTAGLRAMGFDSPRAAAAVLGLPHDSDAAVAAALLAQAPVPAGTPKKNLVFFLMESWGAEPIRYQSPQFDVLGRMAPTLDRACHFRNFDSAHGGTHPSLEAILFSTPITPLTLGPVGRKLIPWAIPAVVRQAGYKTLFVSSVRAGWRDLNRVLAAQGFDEIVDANTLKQRYPDAELGIWGVWDSYAFRYVSERLAQQPASQPLFVFVLTSTNHPPYDLPADYKPVARDMALWRGERNSPTLEPNLDTYHYATDLLGEFVQGVQRSPQYANTIIAASGDHNVRSFGVYAQPERRHLMRQVPFVIWGRDVACGDQLDLPASHRDMFPTLLPLAGIGGDYLQTGRNLLAPAAALTTPTQAPRALFFTGEARSANGVWKLGQPDSFACTPQASGAADGCVFNPADDAQERARFALLDWFVRVRLGP